MKRLFVLALLGACAPVAEDGVLDGADPSLAVDADFDLPTALPDDLLPPPMTLTVGTLSPGQPLNLSVTGANPGDPVYFAYGLGGVGAGPTVPFFGGLQLGILPPVGPLPGQPVIANASGNATYSVIAPNSVRAGTVAGFQAVGRTRAGAGNSYASNAVSRTSTRCFADGYENDDDWNVGTELRRTVPIGKTLCWGDDDWYYLDTPGGATATFQITSTAGEGATRAELWHWVGSSFVRITSRVIDSTTATITYTPSARDILYLGLMQDAEDGSTPGVTTTVVATYPPTRQRRMRDIDGDGFDDAVVGASHAHVSIYDNAGTMNVFYGGTTLSTTASRAGTEFTENTSANTFYGTNSPSSQDDLYGDAIAIGDFDDDGYADVAIGAPGDDPSGSGPNGWVDVLDGTSFGLNAGSPTYIMANSGLYAVGNGQHPRLGDALAVGDFNADGYADLVVGMPAFADTATTSGGGIMVVYGSLTGLDPFSSVVFSQASPGVTAASPEDGDGMGAALAAGDINGDGYDDIVIGAPTEDIGTAADAGAIVVLFGGLDGLHDTGSQVIFQNNAAIPAVSEAGDLFGAAVTVGDWDGDGYADVAVGAYGENSNEGGITVLYGSSTGLNVNRNQVFSQTNALSGQPAEAGDLWGYAVAAGDFDGDGYDDLIAGAPYETETNYQAGLVTVQFGSPTGLLSGATGSYRLGQSEVNLGTYQDQLWLGTGVSACDMNADGYDDIIGGMAGRDVTVGGTTYDQSGAVVFWTGTSFRFWGSTLYLDQNSPLVNGSPQDFAWMGIAVQ
ncbi:MAG: FG-GAP repeat protein [Alphaproteobacteria bacterium]|nr:FG-GAP repeat protein [Alphaproteobacteria bacterium]